jgi:DNA polymerase III epsilon subunit family exonuclease
VNGFAVLDLETTGLSADNDRIIEIGVLMLDPAGVEERYIGSLVNPFMPIPRAATAVNNITDKMVSSQPHFAKFAKGLARVLEGKVIVGHNVVGFDLRFMRAEFSRAGVSWEPTAVIDTLNCARKLYPSIPSRKLDALCKLAGITNTNAHRAEGDVRATWELLCALQSADVNSVTGLHAVTLPPARHAFPPHLVPNTKK